MKTQKLKDSNLAVTCTICQGVIKATDFYCKTCGPPEPPPEEISNSVSFGGALFRIFLIFLVFAGVIFYKYQPEIVQKLDNEKLGGLLSKFESILPTEKGPPQPETPDFKLVHTINVPFANIRAEASRESEVVAVREFGDVMQVIQKKEGWSELQLEGKTGWISSKLLDSRVE